MAIILPMSLICFFERLKIRLFKPIQKIQRRHLQANLSSKFFVIFISNYLGVE